MYAYGGAGPVHATAIAQEIGIRQVMVPLSNFAAGWSAFGVAASEALVVEETAVSMSNPFDPEVFNRNWVELENAAIQRLLSQGVARETINIERYVDMRYAVQVNQIEISAPADKHYDEQTVARLLETFESEYERLFGKGSGYADAGFALTAMRVRLSAPLSDLKFDSVNTGGAERALTAKSERPVIWYERGTEPEMTPVYDGTLLAVGQTVTGPAILEYPDTTVVLRYGNLARLNSTGCILIDINAAEGGA
jgi:N-methylhydantoinase A